MFGYKRTVRTTEDENKLCKILKVFDVRKKYAISAEPKIYSGIGIFFEYICFLNLLYQARENQSITRGIQINEQTF